MNAWRQRESNDYVLIARHSPIDKPITNAGVEQAGPAASARADSAATEVWHPSAPPPPPLSRLRAPDAGPQDCSPLPTPLVQNAGPHWRSPPLDMEPPPPFPAWHPDREHRALSPVPPLMPSLFSHTDIQTCVYMYISCHHVSRLRIQTLRPAPNHMP